MRKIIIIRGGWSACAAAMGAKKAAAEATVIKRTDMLFGTGQVGGIILQPKK